MADGVTITVTVQLVGNEAAAQLGTALGTPLLPRAYTDAMGAWLLSDTVANGPPATRTVIYKLVPSITALLNPPLVSGGVCNPPVAGPVAGPPSQSAGALTITNPGLDYTALPDIVITDPAAAAGGAQAQATQLSVGGTTSLVGGTGYLGGGGGTFAVVPLGGLSPGGKPAVITATVVAGVVTALAVTTVGTGYFAPPFLNFQTNGGGGTGASARAQMQLAAAVLINGGKGYTAPVIAVVGRYVQSFPKQLGAHQLTAFKQLLKAMCERAVVGPVVEAAVLS